MARVRKKLPAVNDNVGGQPNKELLTGDTTGKVLVPAENGVQGQGAASSSPLEITGKPINSEQTNTKDDRNGLSPSDTTNPTKNVDMPTPAIPDPFDPERLRLTQNFADKVGVQKLLTTVPVRKPAKEWWIQAHPAEKYRIQTGMLELKEDREIYLVDPTLWPALAMETTFSPRLLVTTINRQGTLFLWPIRLPGTDGKIDHWSRSALEAAQAASGTWIRVAANMSLGAYDVFQTLVQLAPPEWPTTPFNELLRTAFRDKFIDSPDHIVLKKLRGEM
jgi:hypothetical protein